MPRRDIAQLPIDALGQLAQQPRSRAAVLRHPQIGPHPPPPTPTKTPKNPRRGLRVRSHQIQHLRHPPVLIGQTLKHPGPRRRIRRRRRSPKPLIAVRRQPRPERHRQLRDPIGVAVPRRPALPVRHTPRHPARARQQPPHQTRPQACCQLEPQPTRQHLVVRAHAHIRHRPQQITGHPNPPQVLGPLHSRDRRQLTVQPPQIPSLDNARVECRRQSPQPIPRAALAPQPLQQPHLRVVVHHPTAPALRQHAAHGANRHHPPMLPAAHRGHRANP